MVKRQGRNLNGFKQSWVPNSEVFIFSLQKNTHFVPLETDN